MAELKFGHTTAPSAPSSGKTSIYIEENEKRLKQIDDTGTVRAFEYPLEKLSSPAATSGATETLLDNALIAGSSAVLGDVYRIKLFGISSSTGTLIFRVRAGTAGTTADTQAWISLTSAAQAANQRAGFEALLTIRAVGSGGTIQCEGLGFAQAALLPTVVAAVATPAINTNNNWYIDITATCSVGTFTAQQATIEKL